MPVPNILSSMNGSAPKIENTDTMITAALVTTPALDAMPLTIASVVVAPATVAYFGEYSQMARGYTALDRWCAACVGCPAGGRAANALQLVVAMAW